MFNPCGRGTLCPFTSLGQTRLRVHHPDLPWSTKQLMVDSVEFIIYKQLSGLSIYKFGDSTDGSMNHRICFFSTEPIIEPSDTESIYPQFIDWPWSEWGISNHKLTRHQRTSNINQHSINHQHEPSTFLPLNHCYPRCPRISTPPWRCRWCRATRVRQGWRTLVHNRMVGLDGNPVVGDSYWWLIDG